MIPEQYYAAGKITREVRNLVKATVKPGMRYVEACDWIEREIASRGGKPAFPTGVGINQVTAHYAPQEDDGGAFTESDLIKVDFGVHVDGFVADTAVSLSFNPRHEALLEATERALGAAVETAKKDPRAGEIGRAIFREASRSGFKTIENLTGHTVGQYVVHAGKSIPNLFLPNMPVLKKGDVFAIEPFLTSGSAAGYVVDAPYETIFSIVARKKTGSADADAFLEEVWNERKTLPFTPRWYVGRHGRRKLDSILARLMAKRLVRSYPTLVEASKNAVAQFEHTVALDDAGLVVLT